MSDDSQQHPPPPEPTPPQLHQTIQSGPVSLSLTTLEAVEIAQLCTLAGCPERIVTFLETGRPAPEQVRKTLLDAKAQSAPEILSWLDGHATQTETSLSRPMLAAAKRLGDRQASLRKEH